MSTRGFSLEEFRINREWSWIALSWTQPRCKYMECVRKGARWCWPAQGRQCQRWQPCSALICSARRDGSHGHTIHAQAFLYHLGRQACAVAAVKKITSQNLRPRIDWWINTVLKSFFLAASAAKFYTLVARRRKHFRGFWAIFLVAQLPPKWGVLRHKDSLASCQRCRHSVEPRALTCPFKQSNLNARSYQNL